MKLPFRVFPKRSLGIDIGTSAIRIVELSEWRGKIRLENYGQIKTLILSEKPFRIFERSSLLLASERTNRSLQELLKEAEVKSKKAFFSIPDFSTFFTAIEFPPMGRKELEDAVRYEAGRHVPLPLSEVVLDWQVIDRKTSLKKGERTKVLLVAVPKDIIQQYKRTCEAAKLELLGLEAEVFSLKRALKEQLGKVTAITEIGARSTTVSVVSEQLKETYSFDVSGNELTRTLAKSLEISYKEAEALKKVKGIKDKGMVREILLPLIDLILSETKRVATEFARREGKEVEKFLLAGGTARLPGLKEYLAQGVGGKVEIADPFKAVFYPEILDQTLKQLGPSFAIACGIARRGLE